MPKGRAAVCAKTCAPFWRSCSQISSSCRHWFGFWSSCSIAKLTGQPISTESRRIQSISFNAASASSPPDSPAAPAPASSKMPWPASRRARAMPKSSSSWAKVPGTGSPSTARWPMVRDVEKPSAPASNPSRTISYIFWMSSAVAGSLRAPRSPIT